MVVMKMMRYASVAVLLGATGIARAQLPCSTIAEAEALGTDGQAVRLCDVVVSSEYDLINSSSNKHFHVQDATGGITVFGGNALINPLLPQFAVGDSIDIEGTTDTFNGLFELANTDPVCSPNCTPLTLNANNGAVGAPAPDIITASQMADASPTAEFHESRLVRLNCVLFTATGNFTGNTNYTIIDSTGSAVVRIIEDALELLPAADRIVGKPIPATPVDIIGIFSQFDGSDPRDGGYQLLPRFTGDIIANACPTPEVPPTATGALVIECQNVAECPNDPDGPNITLTGTSGNLPSATTRFRIKSLPTLGTLKDGVTTINAVPFTLSGNTVAYEPNAGTTGRDGFNFDVWNGLAGANERFSTEATESVAIQMTNSVFVTEFMANPSGGNDFDPANPQEEYIEVYNPTASPVTLGHIGDSTTPDIPVTTNGNLEEGGPTVVPAMSSMIIAHSHSLTSPATNDAFLCCWGLTGSASQVRFVQDAANTGIPPLDWKGLSNAGDVIYVYDALDRLVDVVAYRANTPPPYNGSWPADNGFGSAALVDFGAGLNSVSNDNGANWLFHDPAGGLEGVFLFGMYDSCAEGATNVATTLAHDRGSPLHVHPLLTPPTPAVPPTPLAASESVVAPDTFVDITLTSDNNGGTMSYVIESLSTGQLSDPNGGIIIAAPYTLLANGAVVRYTPPANAAGLDSFLFSAIENGAASCTQATESISYYTFPAGPDLCLIISEVVDGDRPGGTPKWVEITNTSSNSYTFPGGGLIVQSNAGADVDVDVDLTGVIIAAGDSFVIANSLQSGQSVFEDTYGGPADLYSGVAFGNGNDRYMITSTDDGSNIIDIYGEFGVDGTGTAWEYTDSYARRQPAFTQGSGIVFNAAEWTIAGPLALDGADDAAAKAALIANTFPFAHTFNPGCVSQGACCNGVTCSTTTQSGCGAGTYQGDGSICTPNPCGPTGACCTDNFGCVADLTFDECAFIGGLGWNQGQACSSCPQPPTGACCNFDGSCDNGRTTEECASTNGIYQGDGSTCAGSSCPQPSDDLLITEIVDGTLVNGVPKWVEITNCGGTSVELGLYNLANFNNGSATATNSYQLAGTLAAGDSFVFEYDNTIDTRFQEVYGFPADQLASNSTNPNGRFINGDDAIALINGPAVGGIVVDVYGEIGVDGTGAVWEYLDGYSRRNPGAAPSATFVAAQWTFGGIDSLEGGVAGEADELALLQSLTEPGTHDCVGIPAATVSTAVSRRTNPHLRIDCDTNLLPPRKSEPHSGGILEIRIGFDVPPGLPIGSGVTIEQATCAAPAFVPYAGAAVASGSVVGNELVVNFSPALENARTYRMTVDGSVTTIAGQAVEVRGLIGDVNSDRFVNATDRSVVVGAWTGPGGWSCPTDVNNSGLTNATDRSVVVGAWTGGTATNCAP